MLFVSLLTGFAWAHANLRVVLESRNDVFLQNKLTELASLLKEESFESQGAALLAEIRREVAAYGDQGLVIVVRGMGDGDWTVPSDEVARGVAERLAAAGLGEAAETIAVPQTGVRHRAAERKLDAGDHRAVTLQLALSLAETEAALNHFDRRMAAGALAFLALAAAGGWLLSRQALRPVAESIATARRLNPKDLRARLPLSGADDELDQLAATINQLLDRLAEYHAQIIRFIGDASHELRSPLGAMRAAVEVTLQQARTADEYREALGALGEQCDHLGSLVNRLLLLAKADAGQIEVRPEPIDLAGLIDDVVELYRPLAEERGLRLEWERAASCDTRGDPTWLRQLIVNLLDNAIKFTAQGGRVSVRLETDGQRARIAVSDSGVGIGADHLPHLFERFYQVDRARSVAGHGLGLSICRWIVDAHAGTIEVTSRLREGSSFVVTLPVDVDPPAKAIDRARRRCF
ncbi:MAG TPA: ATP-binding protein [Pirellulales bacterium]|nr:ATP-binding protein [Pirellulales bacterium]